MRETTNHNVGDQGAGEELAERQNHYYCSYVASTTTHYSNKYRPTNRRDEEGRTLLKTENIASLASEVGVI